MLTPEARKDQSKPHSEPVSQGCCCVSVISAAPASPQQQLLVQLFRSKSHLIIEGVSQITVPARQALGREPAFHSSFTLLPQIIDLETSVNMQTQESSPVIPPFLHPSFLEGQALLPELSLCCLGVCIRMEALERIFGCGYNRNSQSCQKPRASISETAASSCALFHFTSASAPAQVRHSSQG